MSLGLSSTSDVIPFHLLHSTCGGGGHLSNDAQIRVTDPLEPEICTKMLKKLSEKLREKFPATTPGCSIAEIARLNHAFFKSFLTASKPSRMSMSTAKRKENEKKERPKKKNSKIEKLKDIGHFLFLVPRAHVSFGQRLLALTKRHEGSGNEIVTFSSKILISAHARARMS